MFQVTFCPGMQRIQVIVKDLCPIYVQNMSAYHKKFRFSVKRLSQDQFDFSNVQVYINPRFR